jgi:FecR-like protein
MRWPGRYAALLRELRQAPVPEWNHARVRARVLARVERERANGVAPSERARGGVWWPVLAAGGLALGALLWQRSVAYRAPSSARSSPSSSVSKAPALAAPASGAPASAAPEPRDGASLRVGERLVAEERALRVEHAGRSAWSLAAGSSARLLALGDVMRIELERGVLSAQVTPRASASPLDFFVVQGRGTEVSVHGTRFSVSALDGAEGTAETLRVEVEEGVVQVRALGAAAGVDLGPGAQGEFVAGRLVRGTGISRATDSAHAPARAANGAGRGGHPARASASPAPRDAAASLAERASDAPPRLRPTAPPSAPGDARLIEASAEAPDARAVGRVVARIQGCFHRYTRDRGDMRIQARSTLRLDVLPSGELLRAELDPPLAPGIERCLDEALAAVRFEPSASGYRIERGVQLSTE